MGYNFASSFGFQFRLEIYKLFFHSFCWKSAGEPQHSILNTFFFSLVFCCIVASFSCTVFDPGLPSNSAHRFSIRFLPLTLFVHFLLCVSYFDLQISFLFNPCLDLRVFVHSFALQWLPFFAPLGASVPQLFGLRLHFLNLPL